MIERVGKCVGVTLWRRPRVEIWICSEGVREHAHPGQRVEVLVLAGRGLFWRVNPAGGTDWMDIEPRTHGQWLTIPEGWAHGFRLASRWLIFVNKTAVGSPARNLVWR